MEGYYETRSCLIFWLSLLDLPKKVEYQKLDILSTISEKDFNHSKVLDDWGLLPGSRGSFKVTEDRIAKILV
jgi:hypothetical protein